MDALLKSANDEADKSKTASPKAARPVLTATAAADQPKKKPSRTPLFLLIAIIGALVAGAATYGLMSLFLSAKVSDSAVAESTATDTTTETNAALINQATSIYTSAVDAETSTVSSDDSALATENSDAAGVVGDSIDENDL